jgi:HJR/Mrr/RecB family endonuclease
VVEISNLLTEASAFEFSSVSAKKDFMDWLFRCNPKRFDLEALLDGGAVTDDWAMNQHRQLVSPGDRVFFWQTGPNARLLAIGHITSPVYERENSAFGRYCVDVVFDYRIEPPLNRSEAIENKSLCGFAPFKWAMGTNFPISDPAISEELGKVLEHRLIPIAGKKEQLPPATLPQQSLDSAIKQAKRDISQNVRKHIEQMDPIAFEWLVRALLLKLGYKDVNVTKASGDGGVDVRARLVAGGIASQKTCIQVKRQPSVGRPIVQKIRGSLSAHEAGLLVTSGTFTDGAREEAIDPHKIPIALVDGAKLTELLLDHEIGVEHVNLRLYRLKLEDLSKEQLEARVEESDENEA